MPDSGIETPALIAILRGVAPDRVVGVANILVESGIGIVEVPLNSPDPFASIAALARRFGARILCGAGTVTDAADVSRVADAGGRIVVAPNTNPSVIGQAIAKGLIPMPGFATATEAFAAIAAGARHLKLFPARTYGPAHLKALKAVLPRDVAVHAVGGIGPGEMAEWIAAGANGFGLGSELFRPGYSDVEIAERARRAVAAFEGAIGS